MVKITLLIKKMIRSSKTTVRGFTPLEITGAKKKRKENKFLTGFTLLELIVAIFVIVVGIIGGMTAIQRTSALTITSSSRLVAIYLAQEGIEIVRNVRDTNWLEARTAVNLWDEGLDGCAGGCIVDYNHSYGPDSKDPVFPVFAEQPLNINFNGFYSYAAGTPTLFKRKITITKPAADTLQIFAEVSWTEKEQSHSFSIQEYLYNWR